MALSSRARKSQPLCLEPPSLKSPVYPAAIRQSRAFLPTNQGPRKLGCYMGHARVMCAHWLHCIPTFPTDLQSPEAWAYSKPSSHPLTGREQALSLPALSGGKAALSHSFLLTGRPPPKAHYRLFSRLRPDSASRACQSRSQTRSSSLRPRLLSTAVSCLRAHNGGCPKGPTLGWRQPRSLWQEATAV